MNNPFPIDAAFIVSLAKLQAVCDSLQDENKRWWIESETESHFVTINYSPSSDSPDTLSFRFPIVAKLLLLGPAEGTMVCLYPLSALGEQSGLCFEGNKLVHDDTTDWENFWLPIEAKLISARSSEAQTLQIILQGTND